LRSHVGDVTRGNHREPDVGCDRAAIDSLVPDEAQRCVKILEEVRGSQNEHVHPRQAAEPLFLGVEASDWSRACGLIGTSPPSLGRRW
jgi:hypothetical protein